MPTPMLSDYNVVDAHVSKTTTENGLPSKSVGFAFFSLDQILNLQPDEVEDAQTDTFYLRHIGDEGGHDRGIDALYIDESTVPATIHIFNFKYKMSFRSQAGYFPSGEIDKIISFLTAVQNQNRDLGQEVNAVLFEKVEDIWDLFSSQNPEFIVHICTNDYLPFEEQEKARFERELSRVHARPQYHLMTEYVERLTRMGRQIVNGEVRVIDTNYFEKSDGDIRALIVNLDVRDLLRLVIDDEAMRLNPDPDNYDFLHSRNILEDSFEDNVRIYLRQRSKINRNIKETALSDDAGRFFYFNNGITITCRTYSYVRRRSPIVRLNDLQVVNGSQTIHALHEAYISNPIRFDGMDILCRIYETENEQLSNDIAEYTNSQNPVKTRDIRSNDYIQKKYEAEMQTLGYFYERKKGQYVDCDNTKRIDAEKAGQALMAFFNKLPGEAKNDKRLIFAEKYDDVFADDIRAEDIVFVTTLLNEIEKKKLSRKREIIDDTENYEKESYILHASYYILYVISELMHRDGISVSLENLDSALALYDEAASLISHAVDKEMKVASPYSHRHFFKGGKPKMYLFG